MQKNKWAFRAMLMVCITVGGVLLGCTTPTQPPPTEQALTATTRPTQARETPATSTLTATAPQPTRTPRPTRTPSPTPYPSEWAFIAPGIERGNVPYLLTEYDTLVNAYAIRINPELARFAVHYDPDNPRTASQWRADLRAPIVVNGSFFTGGYRPFGRIISDGLLYGGPLNYAPDSIGVAGMFTVNNAGQAEIFSLGRGDFTPNDMAFSVALECYPMLLLPGGQPGFPEETGNRARRTVIGMDEEGRVVILIINSGEFTLYELARWLPQTDLKLDTALNLDGGRSSGISVSLGPEQRTIDSAVELPIVMSIGPR